MIKLPLNLNYIYGIRLVFSVQSVITLQFHFSLHSPANPLDLYTVIALYEEVEPPSPPLIALGWFRVAG